MQTAYFDQTAYLYRQKDMAQLHRWYASW